MTKSLTKIGAAEIAGRLRRVIRGGKMVRHDRLPSERQLADTYGVARNTVREALNRLAAEGYVEVRAGSGTYVSYAADAPSPAAIENANPLELMDARFALEPHICRLCVLHGKSASFDTLEVLCEQMEAANDDAGTFAEADTAFHQQLALMTGNGLLVWIIEQINSVRSKDDWTRMRHLTLDEGIIARYNIQHRHILNAIRTREPERAANRMKEHLETARLSLTRAAAT